MPENDAVNGAISALKNGEIIILLDDEKRENEGDFVIAAEFATEERVNFMLRYGRGILCVSIPETRVSALGLTLLEKKNSRFGTPFTQPIDALEGTSTGVSTSDRSKTIKLLADESATENDFMQPGHIFPLVARNGGIKERPGHTEASLEMVKLAGLKPAAAIIEILQENGEMARLPQLKEIAEKHNLKMLSVRELLEFVG